MSFIRPEAQAALWRWRDVLAGLAALALGAWLALGAGGLLAWFGVPLTAGGGALVVIGLQRARFRAGAGGPGMVQVDEGQIAYFGPLEGGVVAASELERLTLDPAQHPPTWVLDRPGQPPLHIPVNAEGAEALFDAFAALPGLRTERMLAELNGRARHPVVIWERRPLVPPGQRLH